MNFQLIKNSVRAVFRNRKSLLINVIGLTISIAVSLLIFSYVYFENSYDSFHQNSDRIYRVESKFYDGKELTDQWATSSFGYASAMAQNMTGIEAYTRVGLLDQTGFVNNIEKNIKFRETRISFVDTSFLKVFSFKLLKGDKHNSFEGSQKVVITESIAKKYFGKDDPIGKNLNFRSPRRNFDCVVSGVIEDFPKNSHIQLDFLVSYETLPRWAKETWYLHESYSYLLLKSGVNPAKLENAFPKMSEKYKTSAALKNKIWGVDLVKLEDIHYTPQKLYERESKGNKQTVNTLLIVAIAILIIAIVNYINLTTAYSLKRAKEVSIRRVSGSSRIHIFVQMFWEAAIINGISFISAIALTYFVLPVFKSFFENRISYDLFSQFWFWGYMILAYVAGSFLAAIYPSILLASFKMVTTLKGKITHSVSSRNIRKSLVVLQFVITIVMISSIVVISKQIMFMMNEPLGFDINRKVILHYPGVTENRAKKIISFKEELKNIAGIKNVTLSSSVPGMEAGMFFSNRRVEDPQGHQPYEMLALDDEFISAYDFEIVEGRNFIKDSKAELRKILVNQTAVKSFGYKSDKEAVGGKIMLEGRTEPVEIIGVVKDYHQQSLQRSYPQLVFFKSELIGWIPIRFITISMSSDHTHSKLNDISEKWEKYFPESTFNSFFLNSFYEKQYRSDQKFLTIHTFFTILAIFISLLGLWSLTIHENRLRFKEIGVRKVNGATSFDILRLINKDFVKLVLIACLLGCPIAYYFTKEWLSKFAYRIELNIWLFVLAGVTSILIAVITITLQSRKAAEINPVKSLRYE